MPFKPYKQTAISIPTRDTQIPIFLISGILGNGGEMIDLAKRFYTQSENIRPIYVHYDQRFVNPSTIGPILSLSDQAKIIVKDILTCLQPGPLPYVIAGYSYGATLAALVGQELKKLNQDVHLYLLDGASPEKIHELHNPNSRDIRYDELKQKSILEIINIANYAARLSSLSDITLTQEELDQLYYFATESCFDDIEKRMLLANRNASNDAKIYFCNYFRIAKQNMMSLLSTDPLELHRESFDKITLFTTNETAKKFNTPDLGWEKYAKEVRHINDKNVKAVTHTDLMKEKNAAAIATDIHTFIFKDISKEELRKRVQAYLLQESGLSDTKSDGIELPRIERIEQTEQTRPTSVSGTMFSIIGSSMQSNDSRIADKKQEADNNAPAQLKAVPVKA